MNLSEAIVFLIYLVYMLGIGIYFFFKNRNGGDKTYFLGAARWGRGSRRCLPARPT